jgi:hypothetical protein
MKATFSALALFGIALVATSAVATEQTGAQPESVVAACKRHMIGLGPKYEPKFRLCAYLAGAVDDVKLTAADPQADDKDLAALKAFTKVQYTD